MDTNVRCSDWQLQLVFISMFCVRSFSRRILSLISWYQKKNHKMDNIKPIIIVHVYLLTKKKICARVRRLWSVIHIVYLFERRRREGDTGIILQQQNHVVCRWILCELLVALSRANPSSFIFCTLPCSCFSLLLFFFLLQQL